MNDAGYRPIEGVIDLRVTGTVAKQRDRVVLELVGMKNPTTLVVLPARENPDTAPRLDLHVSQMVDVEGRWLPVEGSAAGALAVTTIHTAGGQPR